DKPNVQGLGQEWYFDLDYLTDSLGYTHFKINPPACTHDTNILAGTQADDSDSECDEQVILVPSFPFSSFLVPTVHDVSASIENNLDYVEELARLQRQEYEAHSAVAKHGFEFSDNTAALLYQAAIKIRRNLVLAAGDPASSIVSSGGVPADSVPASGVPAGSLPASVVPAGSVPTGGVPAGSLPASSVLAGGVLTKSIDSAEFGVPTASESVPTVFTNDPTATFPLPPSHSLGSCEHTTRFPSPSDLGNHQPTAGIFSYSSYDDDFCADVTNLASNVAVDPVATKRDPDWVAAMQEEMQQFYHQQVWKLVSLSAGKIAIGTKWILKNKRDDRRIVVRNKARLVAQGHRQEEGIDYDEHHYRRGTIDKTLFLKKDSRHIILVQVYMDDIIFGSTNKAWCDEFEMLMKGEFEMSAM
nr:copia protein [Tanacetum cinerariifolium]